MTIRKAVPLAVSAFLLGTLGSLGSAYAQGSQAPFTIRRPPDGATVKEKVRIEIPRASIRPGSFVAFYIDNKFDIALAPPDTNSTKPFTYVWDTKSAGPDGGMVSDGEHAIRAILYEPVANSSAMDAKAESEVKVNVANIIKADPGPIYLRYKYREGANLTYGRDSKALIVSALSGLQATDDIDLSKASSKHLIGIEDVNPEVSLVRNKLTKLTIEQNGQEMNVDPQQLSTSMYQELDPLGQVHYETGGSSGLAEFTALGLPVNNTLELPLLPYSKVSVGDTWRTAGQRIDIPGLPPVMQPRVTLDNKFVDLEWEGGRPTAKIRQTYEGPIGKTIQFGPIEVTSPTVKYDRVIYLAYKSGTLVKTVRTLTITGRTTDPLTEYQGRGAGVNMAGGYPGMAGGRFGGGRFGGGFPGMMGGAPPGVMGGPPGMMGGPPGMMGGPPAGMMPGGPGGYPGMAGGRFGGGRFGGGRFGGGYPGMQGGGYPGMAGGRFGGGRFRGGSPGMMGGPPGMAGYPGAAGGNRFGGGARGPVTQTETDHPVTLQAITVTGLQSESLPGRGR
jgi:hypothetical protein